MNKNLLFQLLVCIWGVNSIMAMEDKTENHNNQLEVTKTLSLGFYDQLLEDETKDKKTKIRLVEEHVTERETKYELFLVKMGADFSRKVYLSNQEFMKTLHFVRQFFEDKIERLHKKKVDFFAHLEKDQLSDVSRETFTFSPIGTYSGKLKDNQEEQQQYALGKYKKWLFIANFFKQFNTDTTKQFINYILGVQRDNLMMSAGVVDEKINNVCIFKPEELEKLNVEVNYFRGHTSSNMRDQSARSAIRTFDGCKKTSLNDCYQEGLNKSHKEFQDMLTPDIFAQERANHWLSRINYRGHVHLTTQLFNTLVETPNTHS